jgi:RNA polymerase sporulation-specific sigma factor
MAAKPGLSGKVSKIRGSSEAKRASTSSRVMTKDKVKSKVKSLHSVKGSKKSKKYKTVRKSERLDISSLPTLPFEVAKKILDKASFTVDRLSISLDLSLSDVTVLDGEPLELDREEGYVEPHHDSTSLEKTKTVKKENSQLQTVFDLEEVDSPLIGTPKEVQEELDGLALKMQKNPNDQEAFERILTYIHKYLLGLVFKKYNFVKGYEESDIYQEALIALFKKAVPKFDPTRNMSFLNFAKMCINRHLITILHASKHRRKDMPINTAISLDHNPNSSGEDEDTSGCSLSNIISDEKTSCAPYRDLARKEAYNRTLEVLKSKLSHFEIMVLDEYLQEKSYEEVAKAVTKKSGIKYNAKSVDNSLLRIRKKSFDILKETGGIENVPLLF